MVGDERGGVVGDQPGRVPGGDRLRERVDVLVGDLLVDERGEEAGGEAAVVGLLADEGGRGADGQLVELHRRGPVVEAADRAGGDAHRVDAVEAAGGARPTARTILLTSTGSRSPSRLRTRIVLASPHGVSSIGAVVSSEAVLAGRSTMVMVSVLPGGVLARVTQHVGGGSTSVTHDLVWAVKLHRRNYARKTCLEKRPRPGALEPGCGSRPARPQSRSGDPGARARCRRRRSIRGAGPWRRGQAALVVAPATVDEVRAVVRIAVAAGVRLAPPRRQHRSGRRFRAPRRSADRRAVDRAAALGGDDRRRRRDGNGVTPARDCPSSTPPPPSTGCNSRSISVPTRPSAG